MPFKKREVKTREQFLGIWTDSKEYVRRVTGAKGTYQANKALRLSEEFRWPDTSPSYPGVFIFYGSANNILSNDKNSDINKDIVKGLGQSTNAGRATGTAEYDDFDCPAPKKLPLTQDHFLTKLDTMRDMLKAANEEISHLLTKVNDQELLLQEKTSLLRSSSKKIADLQRKVHSLGDYTQFLYKKLSYKTRLGLQCRTPLGSYPLSFDSYPYLLFLIP